MKKSTIVLTVALTVVVLLASCKDDTPAEQFTNDTCDHATELTVGDNFDAHAVQSTNVDATHTGIIDNCSGDINVPEVWFTATVPASGALFVETRRFEQSTFTDTVISSFESCDTSTFIACDDDNDNGIIDIGNFSRLPIYNRAPGEQVYIAVYGYDNDEIGDFLVSAIQFTKEELLAQTGRWKGVTQEVYTDGTLTNTVDISNQELELHTNHTYRTYVDSALDDTGNWSLSNNEETINLFDGNDFTINELTSSVLVFTLRVIIAGQTTDVVFTYNK